MLTITGGFIAPTRALNLLTRAFNLPTRTFNLATGGFELVTRVLLSTFVLFSDVAVSFPCHSNLFLPKTYNFLLVLSNKVLQPLHSSA